MGQVGVANPGLSAPAIAYTCISNQRVFALVNLERKYKPSGTINVLICHDGVMNTFILSWTKNETYSIGIYFYFSSVLFFTFISLSLSLIFLTEFDTYE